MPPRGSETVLHRGEVGSQALYLVAPESVRPVVTMGDHVRHQRGQSTEIRLGHSVSRHLLHTQSDAARRREARVIEQRLRVCDDVVRFQQC